MLLMGAGRDTHTGEFITHFKHEEGVGCRFYQQENLVHIQTVIYGLISWTDEMYLLLIYIFFPLNSSSTTFSSW